MNSITLKGAESASGGGRFSTQIEGRKGVTARSKEVSAAFGIPFDGPSCQSSPCQVATPITIGSSQGTTNGGVPISSVQTAPTCSNFFGRQVSVTAPTGAFYQVTGTGKSLVASTCTDNFNSQISVYNSCDFSQENICEAANSLGGPCSNNGGAQVAWPTNSGQVYYILVHGNGGQTGEFELSVDEVDDDESGACTNADILDLNASPELNGSPVSGTTIGGPTVTGGFSCTYDQKGDVSIFPGVNVAWYKVIGTGKELRAELTYALGAFGGQTGQMALFNSCGDIASSCVGGLYSESFNPATITLVWQSDSSVEYYLMVHGNLGLVDDFQLSLTEVL